MATFINPFIDALWQTVGMPAVALPGTSPVQYSRRPSVFLPALIAAVLPTPVLNALTAAWNDLQLRLTGAPPVAADVAAITAAIVVTDGAVAANQPVQADGVSAFGVSPFPTFVSCGGQLGGLCVTLASQVDASGLGLLFAPLPLNNLTLLGTNSAAATLQLTNALDEYAILGLTIGDTAQTSPKTVEELRIALGAANTECVSVYNQVTNLLVVTDVVSPTDLADAGDQCVTAQALLNDILLWVNTNSGGAPVSIAGGGPFLNLQAWATAQGI